MAHMIYENDGIALARKSAWHGLGIVLDQDFMTTKEAIEAAGLGWRVEQQPLFTYDTMGMRGEVPSHVANVRSDTREVIGVVGSTWVPVQNHEAFAFMDDLLGGEVRYDVAGSLKNGRTVWMVAHLDRELMIGGETSEAIEPYVVLANGHDGMMSLTVFCTPIRVVCQNTLSWSLAGAKRVWKARHTTNVNGKVNEARHTLGLATTYFDQLEAMGNDLITKPISDRRRKDWTERLIPLADNVTDRQRENIMERREFIQQACKVDNLANVYGTAWGWVQGVSEYESHMKNYRNEETRMSSLVFAGDGNLSNKALQIAVASAK